MKNFCNYLDHSIIGMVVAAIVGVLLLALFFFLKKDDRLTGFGNFPKAKTLFIRTCLLFGATFQFHICFRSLEFAIGRSLNAFLGIVSLFLSLLMSYEGSEKNSAITEFGAIFMGFSGFVVLHYYSLANNVALHDFISSFGKRF